MIVDRFGNPIVGNPATSSYHPTPRHLWGSQPRDLPIFTFQTIYSMLLDQTLRLGIAMRAAPICGASLGRYENGEWVDGVKAKDPEVADYVEKQLDRIWKFDIDKVLKAQIWGWSSGEVMWKISSDKKRVEFDYILERHARDVRALEKSSELVGVRFTSTAATDGRHIDLGWGKTFWHTYDAQAGAYYGDSVLKGAYSAWADKWLDGGALDVRRLFMHTDAYGGRRMYYPPGTTDIDGKGSVPNRDIAREIIEHAKSGEVMAIPSTFGDKGNPLWKVEDGRVTANPQHILQYPQDLDVEMLRGIEIPDDILTSEMTGAWQGKKVPMIAFFSGLNRWGFRALEVVVRQIIEPSIMWNFGKAHDFEVQMRPLEEQAMENAEQQDEEEPPGAPQQQQGMMPPPSLPAPPGNGQPTGMSLEQSVGAGVTSALEVIKRAREAVAAGETSSDTVYACLELPFQLASDIRNAALDAIDHRDLTGDGYEKHPHITLKWGLECDPEEVIERLNRCGPVSVRFGETAIFHNDDEDVVYVEVEGEGIREIHELLSDFPNRDEHDQYVPHVTLAHVRAGEGDKYAGLSLFGVDGVSQAFDVATVKDRDGTETVAYLGGKATRFAAEYSPWQRHKGPKGGAGWKNSSTGEVRYQEKRPATTEEKTDKPSEYAGQKILDDLQSRGFGSAIEEITPSEMAQLQQDAIDANYEGVIDYLHARGPMGESTLRPRRGGAEEYDTFDIKFMLRNLLPALAEQRRKIKEASNRKYHPELRDDKTNPGWRGSEDMTKPRIEKLNHLGGGVNESYVATLDDGSKAVFKPLSGERSLQPENFADGTGAFRDTAAWVIDDELGLGLAPQTAVVDYAPQGQGSLQKWSPGKTAAEAFGARTLGAPRLDAMIQDHGAEREDLKKLLLFDVLVGNADRHRANWLVQEGRVVAIDNGMSFPINNGMTDLRTFEMMDRRDREELSVIEEGDRQLVRDLISRKSEVNKRLNPLLSEEEIDSFWQRAEELTKTEYLPTDLSDWSAFLRGARGEGPGLRTRKEAEAYYATMAVNPWSRYDGPRGGKGWRNAETGDILYQEDRPTPTTAEEQPAKAKKTPEKKFEDFLATKTKEDAKAIRRARADGIAIPPAWTEVVYHGADKDIRAEGRDGKGRKQRLEDPKYRQRLSDENNARISKHLKPRMDELRSQLRQAAAAGDEESKVLYLIAMTGFRIGGRGDGKAAKKAYGASTLRGEHVSVDGDVVMFDFPGKKGVRQHHTFKDPVIADMVRGVEDGQPIFQTRARKIRKAWKEQYNGTKVHDLRHVVATELAEQHLQDVIPPPPKTQRERKSLIKQIATLTAKILGNNPSQTLGTYIDPQVWRNVEVAA